jgi:hypothetical protein
MFLAVIRAAMPAMNRSRPKPPSAPVWGEEMRCLDARLVVAMVRRLCGASGGDRQFLRMYTGRD